MRQRECVTGRVLRLAKLLEVWRLEGDSWLRLGSWRGDAQVRAEPFDAIELELGALWRSEPERAFESSDRRRSSK
jgi:hypothetical protein